MRISDCSSDVCSSDLPPAELAENIVEHGFGDPSGIRVIARTVITVGEDRPAGQDVHRAMAELVGALLQAKHQYDRGVGDGAPRPDNSQVGDRRSERGHVGEACVRAVTSLWSQYHYTKKHNKNTSG